MSESFYPSKFYQTEYTCLRWISSINNPNGTSASEVLYPFWVLSILVTDDQQHQQINY